jgi:hypothetical protein
MMLKVTSRSTKYGPIKKAWTRLSRRAGARFYNHYNCLVNPWEKNYTSSAYLNKNSKIAC